MGFNSAFKGLKLLKTQSPQRVFNRLRWDCEDTYNDRELSVFRRKCLSPFSGYKTCRKRA